MPDRVRRAVQPLEPPRPRGRLPAQHDGEGHVRIGRERDVGFTRGRMEKRDVREARAELFDVRRGNRPRVDAVVNRDEYLH